MLNLIDLSNKHILICENGSGLENVIARQLNELGASIDSIQPKQLEDIESIVKELIMHNGAYDGFVFSITHSDFRPLQYVKPELVNEILQDNYCLFIETMRVLKKTRGLKEKASVVAISSISSIRAMKAKMAFCSAKAALDAAIRCLAVELADKGIRVNSIQKGVVDMDYEKEHIKSVTAINNGAAEKLTPLGPSTSEEVANVVAFLLSDATKTITGTSVVIDGGYTA